MRKSLAPLVLILSLPCFAGAQPVVTGSDALRAAPAQARFEGGTLKLAAFVWLDALPPAAGTPIYARVAVASSAPVSSAVMIVQAWLLSSDGPPVGSDQLRPQDEHSDAMIESVATFHAPLAAGSTVRVAVVVADLATGATALLTSPPVSIRLDSQG